MAAPVAKGDELELDVDSLAYGGNGVARLDGFVVFVRRGLARRPRSRARDEGQAQPRRGARDRGAPGGARAGRRAVRALSAPAADAASRTSPTRRSSRRRRCRSATRSQRLAGIAEPPLEPIVPCEPEIFHYRNKLEYSFTATPDGPALGFHRAGRWDEVLEIERCWLTDELGNGIRDAVRDWAREEGLEAYSQADAQRISAPSRRAAGPQHRSGARPARDRARRPVRDRLPRRRPPPLPRGALDPLVGERHAGRGHEPADAVAVGRGVDRGGAVRAALPRPAERVSPDEHGDGRAALRARARGSGAHGRRDGLGSLLRDRHDRALARRATR